MTSASKSVALLLTGNATPLSSGLAPLATASAIARWSSAHLKLCTQSPAIRLSRPGSGEISPGGSASHSVFGPEWLRYRVGGRRLRRRAGQPDPTSFCLTCLFNYHGGHIACEVCHDESVPES